MVLFGNVRYRHRAVMPSEFRQLTTVARWAKTVTATEKNKAELHVYLRQSVLWKLVSYEMVQGDDAIIRVDQYHVHHSPTIRAQPFSQQRKCYSHRPCFLIFERMSEMGFSWR